MKNCISPNGKTLLCCLVLLGVFCPLVFGQGITTGAISGTVVDPQEAVVGGASVTVANQETGIQYSTNTDANGFFAFNRLPIGTYAVAVQASGFQKLDVAGVIVNSGRTTALGLLKLQIGSATAIVEVVAGAPLIESTSSQVTTTFEKRKVAELPISNNYDTLAFLIPGVTDVGDSQFSNTNGGGGISANGQRGRSNNFQIDGQANNDSSIGGPNFFVSNQDIIAEVQVISNNFSAEYGRNAGTVVNYLTKYGTNKFHGTAFEFYTGSFLDSLANQEKSSLLGFCKPGEDPAVTGCSPVKVPRFVENRFGGTLGGPILKDKAWFFGSYQQDRTRQGGTPAQSSPSITPTPTGLQQLQTAFPGNPGVAALTTIGPFAVAAGNPVVTGSTQVINVSDGTTVAPIEFGAVQRALPAVSTDEQWSIRGDVKVSSKDYVFGRYLFEDFVFANSTGRRAAGAVVDIPGRTQDVGGDWVRNWSNRFTNQFRGSYSRAKFGFEGGTFPDCLQTAILKCPSGISFSSGGQNMTFGMQSNLPQGRLVQNYQGQDNAIFIMGKNTFKFGAEYDVQNSPNTFLPNTNGTFTFVGNRGCAEFQNLGADLGRTACGFSNLLANTPTSLNLADGSPTTNFTETDVAWYLQDDIRVKDNLTLNLGIRYEWFQQGINKLHDQTVRRESDPATAFFDTSLPLELRTVRKVKQDLNNWGPNVGFAYTPHIFTKMFGRNKTVIRGGYRVNYDPSFFNIFLNVATAAPVVNLGTITGFGLPGGAPTGESLRAAGALALIPRGANPGFRSQTTVPEDFHNPYTQNWSFGVEREITPKLAAEVRYVGNHTVGQFQTVNGNPALRSSFGGSLFDEFPQFVPLGVRPCDISGQPGFREGNPDCNRRQLRTRTNGAWSIYHGVQSRLDFRNFHGFTGGVSYTFSRTLDNVSEIFSTFGGGNTVAGSQNPFDPNLLERGQSGFSFPHIVAVNWIYDLPFRGKQAGLLGKLLGGWQVNGIYRYRSGQVFSSAQGFGNAFCDLRFSTLTFFGADTCRPIISNSGAPLDTAGICTDSTLSDCGLQDFFTGAPISATDVHFIFNDNEAARFFKNPFAGSPRNIFRGQSFSNIDAGLFKNTRITETMTLQLRVEGFNVFNRQFRGTPDPFVDDCPLRGGDPASASGCSSPGSFMNNLFNDSGRRRFILSARFIF